ncbi:tryptophan-rich sensory protein [Streptomyces sp. NPDC001348]
MLRGGCRPVDEPDPLLLLSLAVNLALNAGWNWLFFGLRSPKAGLAGTLLLDLSNAQLIRRAARTIPPRPMSSCRTRGGAPSPPA